MMIGRTHSFGFAGGEAPAEPLTAQQILFGKSLSPPYFDHRPRRHPMTFTLEFLIFCHVQKHHIRHDCIVSQLAYVP
jgi:hypothetical protein